jgi:hypothetical protein
MFLFSYFAYNQIWLNYGIMDDFRVGGNNKIGVNFGKSWKLENGWNGARWQKLNLRKWDNIVGI